MIPVSPIDLHPLEFDSERSINKIFAPSHKIGWLHSLADQPGATFDITIKDGLGRIKLQKQGFGSETEKSGELVNLETHLGEELQIEVSNIKKAKNLKIFLN